MTPQKPNLYAGGHLDRTAPQRKDEAWIAAQLASSEARFLPVWRTQTLINQEIPGAPYLELLTGPEVAQWRERADLWAFLGLDHSTKGPPQPWFVLDLSSQDDAGSPRALSPTGTFIELRTVGGILPAEEAATAAFARGLIWWHHRHCFCGACGVPTLSREGGHVRHCNGCGVDHFPRTDPAVIMLVHRDGHCLLGRQPRFPPGFWSILAGFVEPGESIEEAVIREVREETGVEIGLPHYHSSQPWPFPSSLMLGFMARARTTAIQVQPGEMEDARWFPRAEIKNALANPETSPLRLPRRDSISRLLLENWAAGRETGEPGA